MVVLTSFNKALFCTVGANAAKIAACYISKVCEGQDRQHW